MTRAGSDFASRVQRAANKAPLSHGYGAREVYISRIYNTMRSRLKGMSLDEFKRQLTNSQREGKISMVRADLTDAHDAHQHASEIEHLGAQFHLIRRSRDVADKLEQRVRGRSAVKGAGSRSGAKESGGGGGG